MEGLDALEDEGNTLVMFTSDNGPEAPVNFEESRGEWDDFSRDRSFGTPGQWRGMKRYPYEGGHRVPGIARWSGKIAPGSINESLINGTDFLPTLVELAGISLPTDRTLHGDQLASTNVLSTLASFADFHHNVLVRSQTH